MSGSVKKLKHEDSSTNNNNDNQVIVLVSSIHDALELIETQRSISTS